MPLESLSCTGCGATDVQEVKPSTYFATTARRCSSMCHLWCRDLRFVKWSNAELAHIGQCYRCKRPFCATHQAREADWQGVSKVMFVDYCVNCQDTDRRQVAESMEKARRDR